MRGSEGVEQFDKAKRVHIIKLIKSRHTAQQTKFRSLRNSPRTSFHLRCIYPLRLVDIVWIGPVVSNPCRECLGATFITGDISREADGEKG